jgi:hypothetical protein
MLIVTVSWYWAASVATVIKDVFVAVQSCFLATRMLTGPAHFTEVNFSHGRVMVFCDLIRGFEGMLLIRGVDDRHRRWPNAQGWIPIAATR